MILVVSGKEILLESKDFSDRMVFNRDEQERVALRWAAAPRRMETLQRIERKRWGREALRAQPELQTLATQVCMGKMPVRAAKRRAQSWLERWGLKAYLAGLRAVGIKDRELTPEDLAWLRDEYLKTESTYLFRMLDLCATGRVSVAMGRYRATMYVRGLDAVFYTALLSAHPARGTKIIWHLGTAEHCPDCVAYGERRFFTMKSLPTTPRAGRTRCRTNCRCWLSLRYVPSRVHVHVVPARAGETFTDDPWLAETGIEPESPVMRACQE